MRKLQQVRDPKRRGVHLTPTNSDVIVTKSGWKVINYAGDDGNTYEQAIRNNIVKWFCV